jgi:predicted protein tyrosine phosphatase
VRALPFDITIRGIEELPTHCARGVSHVLSILDPDYPELDAFGAFGEHRRQELRFHDVIEDSPNTLAPRDADVARLLAFGRDLQAEPRACAHLLVHCHAGISRSTAAMALILAQALPDRPGGEIFQEVLRVREKAWPNLRLLEIGDALLGCGGKLTAAAHRVYRRQLEIRPHLAEAMIQAGRGREVEAARTAGFV